MQCKIIACVNNTMSLGLNGDLLYHIKEDLRNFKRMTIGNVIVMGRKTFESLPNQKPLSDRINVILTKNKEYNVEGAYVVHDIDELIELWSTNSDFVGKEVFVIGGASIYEEFLSNKMVDTIYLTEVIDDKKGDVFFPNFSKYGTWNLFYKSETQFNQPPYTFSIFKRKF